MWRSRPGPSMVCASASTVDVAGRDPRAVAAVTGPMRPPPAGPCPRPTAAHEVGDRRRRREGDGVGARAPRHAAASVERRRDRPVGVDAPRRPSPAARRPSGSTSRATSARASSTRPAVRRRVREGLEQRLGHEPLRHQVGHEAALGQRGGRARADGGHPHPGQVAGVAASAAKVPTGPVGRGQHHPVVRRRRRGTASRRAAPPSDGSAISMVGHLDHLGAQPAQPVGQLRRPGPGPG